MNEIATALRTLLATNIISFTFRKVNGELRDASELQAVEEEEESSEEEQTPEEQTPEQQTPEQE